MGGVGWHGEEAPLRRLALLVVSFSVAAVALVVGVVPSPGVLLGLLTFAGAGWLVALDSACRGRSWIRWLLACALVPPIGLPVFVVVALTDRLAGRHGIEAAWPPPWRLPVFGAAVLAIAAAALALAPLKVQGASVSGKGGYASYSGQCGSALTVAIEGYPWPTTDMVTLPGASAARTTVTDRCFKASGHRLALSVLLLIAALVTLAGAALLLDRRLPPTAEPRHGAQPFRHRL